MLNEGHDCAISGHDDTTPNVQKPGRSTVTADYSSLERKRRREEDQHSFTHAHHTHAHTPAASVCDTTHPRLRIACMTSSESIFPSLFASIFSNTSRSCCRDWTARLSATACAIEHHRLLFRGTQQRIFGMQGRQNTSEVAWDRELRGGANLTGPIDVVLAVLSID